MDYRPSDSSGTDDDIPPSRQSRFQRGGHPASNGWPSVFNSAPLTRGHHDMEAQIHLIEQEAYYSILCAFKAQSDAITWEKEGLITELRKELRVSDEEHRESLSRVNSDDTVKRIREWRQSNGVPHLLHVSGSHKKQKISQSMASMSIRREGPPPCPKTKKPKTSLQYRAPGNGGTSLAGNLSGALTNESAELGFSDPLIGRKFWTRLPEDNRFFEAVVTDCNLAEISPEDIRWEGEDQGVSRKGRAVKKGMPRNGPTEMHNDISKISLGKIKILHTTILIKEVKKVFGSSNSTLIQVEKARTVLRDHEQALIDAIAKLDALFDGETDEGDRAISHGQSMDYHRGWKKTTI